MQQARKFSSFKCVFAFLFVFAFAMDELLGQEVELKVQVKSSDEHMPLPYCNLYLLHHGVGQSTNFDGWATLRLSPSRKQDSLNISFIGYESKTIAVLLENNAEIQIELDPATHLIDAAVVKYVKPPKPKNILRKAINNTSKNYPTESGCLKGYYSETIKEHNKFIQFNDAQVEVFYSSYPQSKLNRKQWINWYNDQRYVFDLEANGVFYELLHDFNQPEDKMKIVASRSSENWSKEGYESALMGGPLSLTSLDKIKYQYDFLNPTLLNDYHLKLEGEVNQNGTLCYLISFYPKESKKNFRIDQSRKNKRAIYIGEIFIEKSSFAVVKYRYQLAVERHFGFFERHMPLANITEVNYQRTEDHWLLHTVSSIEKRVFKRFPDGSTLVHEGKKDLRIDTFEASPTNPFRKEDEFVSTRWTALRYHRQSNNPMAMAAWFEKTGNAIDPVIVEDLSVKTPLQEQFEQRFIPKKDMPLPDPMNYGTNGSDFIWMKDPSEVEELKGYLQEENAYAKNFLMEERAYQQKLYNSVSNFYKEPEQGLITRSKGDLYYDHDSLDFTYLYQYVDSSLSKPIFNLSTFRDAHPRAYYIVPELNEEETQVLVKFNTPNELHSLLEVYPTGNPNPLFQLKKIYAAEWFNDSTLVIAQANELEQSNTLYQWNSKRNIGKLLYQEADSTFDVDLWKGEHLLLCTLQSKSENEILEIKSNGGHAELHPLVSRLPGVKNTLRANGNCYYLLSNDEAPNGKIMKAQKNNSNLIWEEVLPHDNKELVVDFTITKSFLVLKTYDKTIAKVKYKSWDESKWNELDLPPWVEPNFNEGALEHDTLTYRISGMDQVPSDFKIDLQTGNTTTTYQAELRAPHQMRYIRSTRKMVKGHDGKKIPLTLAASRAPRKEHKGTILRVYGAYGAMTYPYFSAEDVVLMNNGYTIAFAHVRGDGVLGDEWYQQGKLMNKQNSIEDFISCARYLIKEKITTPEHLVAYGNSAGGLVVAAAINQHPELFNTVILDHPFVDVLHSMTDPSLPLTIDEYKEWGNPASQEVYDYLYGYCPYQNLHLSNYPNVIVLSGLKDQQTPCWQQAMYVALLRFLANDHEVLLLTDMDAGHIGSTVGSNWIKQFAQVYSFVEMMQPD